MISIANTNDRIDFTINYKWVVQGRRVEDQNIHNSTLLEFLLCPSNYAPHTCQHPPTQVLPSQLHHHFSKFITHNYVDPSHLLIPLKNQEPTFPYSTITHHLSLLTILHLFLSIKNLAELIVRLSNKPIPSWPWYRPVHPLCRSWPNCATSKYSQRLLIPPSLSPWSFFILPMHQSDIITYLVLFPPFHRISYQLNTITFSLSPRSLHYYLPPTISYASLIMMELTGIFCLIEWRVYIEYLVALLNVLASNFPLHCYKCKTFNRNAWRWSQASYKVHVVGYHYLSFYQNAVLPILGWPTF